jgi:hypothetical protein
MKIIFKKIYGIFKDAVIDSQNTKKKSFECADV